MTALLRVPLAPAALVAVLVTATARGLPALAVACGVSVACAAALLALASAARGHRLLWLALALASAAVTVRSLVGVDVGFSADPLAGVRELLASPLRRLVPEPESAILRGIVLGQRADVPRELALAFARSGTTHLLAISGFNMTLVAGAIGALAHGRARPRVAALLTVASVGSYCALVGLAPSVLRAGLMAGIGALGLALGRPSAALNALCAAAVAMLVVEPSAIVDAGFQLSVTATAGLLLFEPSFAARLARLPRVLRDGLATTLAATLPTIPLVIAVFGRLSLVSPLANLIAVPLFPPLMVSGAAASAVGAVSPDAARPLALVAYAFAFALRAVVERAADLPLAAVDLPPGAASGVAAAMVIALGALALRRLRRLRPRLPRWRPARPAFSRRLALAVGAVLALVIGSVAVTLALRGPPVRVRALDVGQGDAFLLESAGHYALIDGGPDPARLLAELGATLAPWSRRLDVVALTHAHVDHGAGLLALFDRYEIGLAIEPVGLNDVPLSSLWHEAADHAGVAHRAVAAGARVRFGSGTLRILAPNDDPKVDVPSLVLRFEQSDFSMLFMGDATEQAQSDLLLTPAALSARVYVPPHHGAATPNGAPLVAAVRPEAAVLSVGANNKYGHPTPETLAALATVPTYRTDRDGTVEIDVDGAHLSIRTHANGVPAPRGRPFPNPAAPR